MFCWHKWGKWSEAIMDYGGSNHQVRKCEKCWAISRRCAVSIMHAQLQPTLINDALSKMELK